MPTSVALLHPRITLFHFLLLKWMIILNLNISAMLSKKFSWLLSPCNRFSRSGGATVGTIAGAIKGPTTETGLVRGAGVGAVTGAITALQLMDMIIDGEPFSKVSFLSSLVNGQVFVDWVTPAVLKAYQSQISGVETTFADLFDMCEYNGLKGLSEDSINELPRFVFENHCKRVCTICLQNFKNKEDGRELTKCKHVFHLTCIDEWLIRNGSCPVVEEMFRGWFVML
ncbi:putative transcription factor C2H2 family [Helianthus annuus]|nr:putative transcription factor C2H2 family [Helianthus annuus]